MHVKVELNFGEQKFLPYECMYVCERELSLKSKIRMQIIAGDANSMMHSWRVQFICKLLCICNSSSNRSPPCTICIYCLKLHKLISFDSVHCAGCACQEIWNYENDPTAETGHLQIPVFHQCLLVTYHI
jgi:hypothetical protein